MNQLIALPAPSFPALIAAAGDRAQLRFVEFFAAAIRNPHTRRAYVLAVAEFLGWCAAAGVASISEVEPLHVAAWIERQTRKLAAPTVKQQLAAIHHLFDWLVTGQIVPANPAASARGADLAKLKCMDALPSTPSQSPAFGLNAADAVF